MSAWCGLLGHAALVERLRCVQRSGRWASAYLLAGPTGVGKYTFARAAAKTLLCDQLGEEFAACGACSSCRQFDAGAHADYAEVAKPADRANIPIDLLIGPKERRMREGLCHWIGLSPVRGDRKIAVINDAEFLYEEGANSLLKTLEEPPPGSVIFLVAASAERMLPTIRSRSQLLRFGPLEDETVAELSLRQGLATEDAAAAELARRCGGSMRTAAVLAGGKAGPEIDAFLRDLADPEFDPYALAARAQAFAEAAGKESAKRRERLRLLVGAAAGLLHHTTRDAVGAPSNQPGAATLAAGKEVDSLLDALDRTTTALQQIDRNANQATLLAGWLDDVARALRGEVLA